MSVFSYIIEARKERLTAESHSINGYSHLMKCAYHGKVNPSWRGTILNCNRALYDISIVDIRRVMSDNIAMERIKRKAIKKYIDEENPDGERMFKVIISIFPTLMDLRDPYKVTNYLIGIANQSGDDETVRECKKYLSELKL